MSAATAPLACIAIQANQNDQHGGQSIPNFEYGLAPGVAKTFIKELCLILISHMESKDAVKAGLRATLRKTNPSSMKRPCLRPGDPHSARPRPEHRLRRQEGP
ncbi:MAG: anaerobic ribonucleoside-triphosphate reductase [Bilophila wadsworthia]